MPAFPYPHPQPTNNQLVFNDAIANDVSVAVYTKQRWANEWVLDNAVDVLNVTWNAAPNIPTATLRYRYGRVVEQGALVESTRTKRDWLGHYVKLVVTCADGNRIWHGFVDDLADEQTGIVTRYTPGAEIGDPPTAIPEATGIQTISCVGMIAALDRAPIQRTYFYVGQVAFGPTGTENERVAWSAPVYNVSPTRAESDEFGGAKLPASRSNATVTAQAFGIAGAANIRQVYQHTYPGLYGTQRNIAADVWTLGNALENLVAYNAPRVGVFDDNGPQLTGGFDTDKSAFVPVWIFDHDLLDPPNTTTQYADWFEPRLDCEGMTLKGALDRLLNQANGQGYWVWVDETATPHRVYVEPYTTITAPLTVQDEAGANKTFPANTRVVNLQTATDSATALSVQSNGAQQYTAVVVEGAPEISVFTIETTTQLEPAWPTALETEYNAEIAGLNPAIMRQLQRIRDLRELPKYQPIGRHYRIRQGYDWTFNTADVFRYQGQLTGAGLTRYLPFPHRLRILPELPLRQGVDYAAAAAATVRTEHERSKTPFRRIEVYAKTHESDGTLTGKWICWSTKAARDVLYDPNDPPYSLSASELRAQLELGLSIDVSGGYQGALATGTDRIAPHVPKIAPAELRMTIAAQSDAPFAVVKRNPATIQAPQGATPGVEKIDADRIKVFALGERLRRVEVLAGTIVGVNDAGPVTVPNRLTIRDDTPLATQLAEFAATYYFQPRSVVRIVSRRATAKLWPGQIVGSVNAGTPHAVTANAVISEVQLTLGVGLNGSYTQPTFTVQTSFGELDPLQFFPRLRGA
jgi:hypothetical protein